LAVSLRLIPLTNSFSIIPLQYSVNYISGDILFFSKPSIPALDSCIFILSGYRSSFPGEKYSGRDNIHSSPTRTKVKSEWRYNSVSCCGQENKILFATGCDT
jgi:hypothetical protein